MKWTLILCSLCICLNLSYGQTEDEILAEAYLLYNSEKASWNGTDLFLERFPEKRSQLGGYFSYSEKNNHHCIFFNQDKAPKIVAKITFDESFDIAKAVIDTTQKKLNEYEMDLFQIRKNALKEINSDKDLFKTYNNTNLNPIPIINGKDRKVFVLTGPKVSGVVILGNDYLLTFDKNNNLKEKKALHKNIIPIKYDNTTKDVVTMHSHLKTTGNLITSTDICTIMLYEKYANWKQHYVISKKNVSIWDCKKDALAVLTRKAWEKINKHQKNKK